MGTGYFSRRTNVTSRDGIGQVAASFNRIAEALSAKDLELRKSNAELKEKTQELNAFSYSVAHDLRAPLRHITSFGNILKENVSAELDEKNRRHLDMILDSTRQMSMLVDDLLVFSRIGQVELRCIPVNLDQLVKETLHALRLELIGRVVAWKIDPLPEVYGDPSLLRLALINLISNAVKFTAMRKQAKIEVGSINGASNEWVFYVRDNGVGFDMQYSSKLFGVFERLHGQDEFEGTGVGLANVQRIMQRHGGRVWGEGAVGSGAIFYFALPKFPKEKQHGKTETNIAG